MAIPFGPICTQIFMLHNKVEWLLTVCLILIIANFAFLLSTFYIFKADSLAITNGLVLWLSLFVQYVLVKKLVKSPLKAG